VTASNGIHIRRVWRYQRGNQNPWITEQTIQWLKKTDKQQSKKQYIENRGELSYSGRVSSSFSTSGTRRATIITNLVMNEERTGGGGCLLHVKLIDGHLWHRYSVTVNQVMVIGVDLTNRNPWFGSFPISSYPLSWNPDRNHKFWNVGPTDRYILHMQVLLECCYI
jgi:hypothetical protein